MLKSSLEQFSFDESDILETLAGTQSPIFHSDTLEARAIAVDVVMRTIGQLFWVVLVFGLLCTMAGAAMHWEKLEFKEAIEPDGDESISHTQGSV